MIRLSSIFIFCIALLMSCKYDKSTSPISQSISAPDFDWLLGKWERTNNKDGKRTFETWIKKEDGSYEGIGWTIEEEVDTLSSEIMVIQKRSDGYVMDVNVSSDSIVTSFEIIDIKSSTFTCSNEENDFPKRIKYMKTDKGMEAVISGGGMEIPFFFVPKKD